MRALEQLGCNAIAFDVTPYFRASGYLSRRLASSHARGPIIRLLNEGLLEAVRKVTRQVDCVWIDKGVWLWPSTPQALKEMTRAPVIHYTPDPHFGFRPSAQRMFWQTIRHYDLLFTTKPFEVDLYHRHGARSVRLVNQSYNEEQLFPRSLSDAERQRFGSQVCFVGQYDAPRARLLAACSGANVHLRVWGPAWRRWRWRHAWLRAAFSGDGAFGNDYALALAGADIGLCFLTKYVPETTTTRTFEIPGCGVFMLAERTDEHRALFEEGVEAEYFSDPAEMSDKIRFYLANPASRARIAAAGHARSQKSGYGNRPRMKELLTHVNALIDSSNRVAA
jgi:spore maturation protein CgeB